MLEKELLGINYFLFTEKETLSSKTILSHQRGSETFGGIISQKQPQTLALLY